MRSGQSQVTFAEEFERVLNDTDTGVRRLARVSGIPRRTLENWLYGQTRRPRHVEPILQVAQALHLPACDTDRLLQSAGHLPLAKLKQQKNGPRPELLRDWQLPPNALLGQKSAALPEQHNLPAAATPFFGRAAMCEDLAGFMRKPDLRLVTISGLGGAGKTRLALESARDLAGRFDHGVYFIPLDNISDSDGFWEAILNGLGVPADSASPAHDLVIDYLQNKQILLLLDNFEHLLHLVPDVNQLLAGTQRLNLLITSRQALDLKAEQLYPIGGLSYVEGTDSPAYQLFVQTARRRVPGFEPSPEIADDILALCEAVDGLPLALELAATWIDVLNPALILDHLRGDLHEVWHSTADRPARQKSLWDLFDYSWRMLDESEQEAAVRLGVLRGDFSSNTALAVAGCNPAILKRLVQSSFVQQTSGSRLQIHRLVRQFLNETAVHTGHNIEDLEDNFMQVTLNWAAEESSELRRTLKAVHYQNLHAEWQHIERAWWLAVERRCYELLDSCWDLIVYFEARATYGQGRAFFEATREQIPATELRMQARLDEALAIMASRLYQLPLALELANSALQTLDDLGIDREHDNAGLYARIVLLSTDYALHQAEFSDRNQEELKEITQGTMAKFAELMIALLDGVKASGQGNCEGAAHAFRHALEVSGPDAYTYPIMRCFYGISLRALGHVAEARDQFSLARERALELEIYPAVVSATYELRSTEGDEPTTQQCREALEQLALELGSQRTVGRVANNSAIQYLNLGDTRRARQMTRIGVGMLWDEVDNAERTRILASVAQAYIGFGIIKSAPQVLSLLPPTSSNLGTS